MSRAMVMAFAFAACLAAAPAAAQVFGFGGAGFLHFGGGGGHAPGFAGPPRRANGGGGNVFAGPRLPRPEPHFGRPGVGFRPEPAPPRPVPAADEPPRRWPRPVAVAGRPGPGWRAPPAETDPCRSTRERYLRPGCGPAPVWARPANSAPLGPARLGLAAPPPPVPPPPRSPIAPAPVAPVARAFPPPPGERRFRPGEVLVELPDTTPPADIARLLRAHRLSEARVVDDALVGTSLRVWRVAGARAVEALVRELGAETALTSVQPNYLYELQQAGTSAVAAAPAPKGPAQYSLTKLHVEPGMVGDPIRVAVIDTAIDETHPDLAGAVEARFDAIGGGAPRSFDHGTSIAGAIAARGRLKGVAPNARILSARAFDTEGGKALGDTASIIGALNWAAKQKARVVNMSFAGAPDPDLSKNLASACRDGLTLVGAAGNAGPASPPLYPGADPNVVAVTATDAEDRLYAKANIGPYIAVSAPGVDVILPAPRGAYALETGTSVSAALVTGVAALLLERRPAMTPAEIRKLLMTTATPLGAAGAAALFGAGLVDARRALSAQAPPQTPATN